MFYVWKDTLSTFNGDRETALAAGYIEISDEDYKALHSGAKKWQDGEIVNDPAYPELKAKRDAEEAEKKRRAPIEREIRALKAELARYDYIGVKIATGCATKEEYAEQIAHCEELRKKIRELGG